MALANALAHSGIRAVELTFTTPGVLDYLSAAASSDAVLGSGTVSTADQAKAAIGAGARFLVTPGVRSEVAKAGSDSDIPVIMGALTPTEVLVALDLGAAAVKIFPAGAFGPRYFKDLRGPFPEVALIPSGGVNAGNAAEFLAPVPSRSRREPTSFHRRPSHLAIGPTSPLALPRSCNH